MRKLFFVFLSVILILGSCVKINDITLRTDSQVANEIVFSATGRADVATKSIVSGTTMIDHFGVYGYVVPGTYSEDGGYLMKNAEYDENGDVADGNHYYWPKSDNYTTIDVLFTAYSQFDTNVEWVNDTVKVIIPDITQDLINNPAGFDDVLYAQHLYIDIRVQFQAMNTTEFLLHLSMPFHGCNLMLKYQIALVLNG